jgi:hypothetical protein
LDHHNDSSVEYLSTDLNGNHMAEAGDVFTGMFIVETVGDNSGTIGAGTRLTTNGALGYEITGIFSTQIISVTPNGSNFDYVFGPDPTFEATYGTGAMAALFFDSTPDYNPNLATAPLSLATASNGTLQASVGFAGLPGEGWTASTTTQDVTALPPGISANGNNYAANLNYIGVLGDYFADLDIAFAQPSAFTPGAFTQFSVNGQVFGNGSSTPFPVGDSTDIFFQTNGAVPEAASLLVWMGLIGAVTVPLKLCRRSRQ